MNKGIEDIPSSDTDIELPLVKLDKEDVLGALFVNTENMGELYRDALIKFQTWIMNYAEEVVKPLRDSGEFSDDFVEKIKKKTCVISPLTLTLYLQWLQMEQFSKVKDSEKERYFLEKIPDRFRSRYRGNASCRNAREVSLDEEVSDGDEESTIERIEKNRNMSFAEFLKEFGKVVRKSTERLE